MVKENPKKLCKIYFQIIFFIQKLFDDKFINNKTTTKTYRRTIHEFKNVT